MLLALILGGGTEQALWSDHLLQILMLPALFLGLSGLASSRLPAGGRILVLLIVALLVLQFVPVIRQTTLTGMAPTAGGLSFFSPTPQKSLDAATFTLAVLGFVVLLSRLSDRDQARLLPFLFIGFFINLVVGMIQLSFDQRVVVADVLPFDIKAGLFANDNHFSSLIYVMIPLIGWRLLARDRKIAFYLLSIGVIVFFLFAVGSRASMAISSFVGILCLIWFGTVRWTAVGKVGLLAGGLVVLGVILAVVGVGTELEGDLRAVFFRTTLEALKDHWVSGSGLGTFTAVYPAYEARENIVGVYANHAHNDYLEIFLETGLAGIVLIGLFFALIVRHLRRSRLAEAAFLSILALALHSLVDYPLRTMALAVVFAYLAGVVLSVRPHASDAPSQHEAKRRSNHGTPDFVAIHSQDAGIRGVNAALGPCVQTEPAQLLSDKRR